MSVGLIELLEQHGATRGQLLELDSADPRTLRYVDLLRNPANDRPALVLESQGQPRAYVFDDRKPSAHTLVPWVRRIAFRGDADFVAVVRPGRLDVYPAVLGTGLVPHPLADLPEGRLRIPTLLHAPPPDEVAPVRTALRTLLRASIQNAKNLGRSAQVDAHDALSLVGRALFWRFLIDRSLLHGLDPAEVCDDARATSLADCLSKKARALATFEWLDRTFNGGLLQFRTNGRAAAIPAAVYEEVVGNIAHAATAEGQLQLELPSQWKDVNFAHVPVGLLSEVYEAFAHDEDITAAEHDSIYYTPRHIAEFMVDEALASLDGIKRPAVLDPAAGAGVFLVAVLRALVAREWTRTRRRPAREAIRRILHGQLTGFDINDSALRLAELALYLTAIELDPEERPRPLSLLKFEPPLRDNALFQREGGSEQGSLVAVKAPFRGRFDLVIGNPPWSAKAKATVKDRWAEDTRGLVKERLGETRSTSFTLPDTYPDIPFVYRAMEWARQGGQIALITHARWLFPGEARDEARRDLLESVQVTGILNGTAVRETSVWPGSRAPFAIVFARNTKPSAPDAAFQFVSPAVMEESQKAQRRLRIDWNDAELVGVQSALTSPWLLKLRFRGTSLDDGVLGKLIDNGFPSFATHLDTLGAQFRNGYVVAHRSRPHELNGLLNLTSEQRRRRDSPNERPQGFKIDTSVLSPLCEPGLKTPLALADCKAPLLLIKKSPPASPFLPRTSISDQALAFSQSWHGASFSGVDDGLAQARWLQLLLQSSTFLYFALLTDGWFGVERDHYVLETLKAFPVVPYERLTPQQRRTALKLSNALWATGWSKKLQGQIDDIAFDLYGLDDVERDSVCDTLATSLPYAEQRRGAVRTPAGAELDQFAATLEAELTSVLDASGERARVHLRSDVSSGPWGVLQVDRRTSRRRDPGDAEIPWPTILKEADDAGATLVTVCVDPETTFVAILKHYRYWTSTRARILALSLLSEKMP